MFVSAGLKKVERHNHQGELIYGVFSTVRLNQYGPRQNKFKILRRIWYFEGIYDKKKDNPAVPMNNIYEAKNIFKPSAML